MTPLLAEKVEGLDEFGDNALDAQVEIALFRPCEVYSGVRSNAAGTKVIYSLKRGVEETYWPRDWTMKRHREETLRLLRARAAMEAGDE